ncbi:phosphatase PAP2 family protein [Paenibacillus sacheonensis]|uniref:Phosphatase PAP2 family protein n=1 Tax=Paenibacillus sacheonensis TaxID=742054 RepID=A0A7X4YPE9_9BACL|nr:phosphatase PAP2 family protein [Paenibacillus sacheonensis]MBM7565115.1 undecaprenyl-diphosphatase [Paenibacillus sacheonensis]NBC70102.1 phosphatase PAP2 family protein [Paenibacillus sacheonensis]
MWIIYLLLAIAGFQGLSMLVSRNRLARFDASIIDTVQGWENDTLTGIAKFLGKVGSSSVVIPAVLLLAAFLFLVLKHRKELVLLLGGMLGSTLLNHLLKPIYRRARPDIHRIVEEQGYSYPSGHSMAAFTFYFLVTYLLWRHLPSRGWRVALLIFSGAMIVSIGLSRVYLGVHYPSDILAGYWVSACWVALSVRLFRQWAHARR